MPLSGHFCVCGTHTQSIAASIILLSGPFLHNLSWIFFICLNPRCPLFIFSLHSILLSLHSSDHTATQSDKSGKKISFIAIFFTWTIPRSSQFTPTGPASLTCSHSLWSWCFPLVSAFFLLHYCLHFVHHLLQPSLFPFPADDLVSWILRMKAIRKHFLAILHLYSHLLHPFSPPASLWLCSFLWSRILTASVFISFSMYIVVLFLLGHLIISRKCWKISHLLKSLPQYVHLFP